MNLLSRRAIDNADKRIKMLEVDLGKWQTLMEGEKKRVAEVRGHHSCRGRSLDRHDVCRHTISQASGGSTCVN